MDVDGDNVTLKCSFMTLGTSTFDYLYEIYWYNGDSLHSSMAINSSMYTADALYNVTKVFGTEVSFKDGVRSHMLVC